MPDQYIPERKQPERGKSPLLKNFIPGLPERGKIKIGEKGAWKESQQGKRFQAPQKLDHFRITTMERENEQQGGNFRIDEGMHKILGGDHLTSIPVVLMFDDIALNFQCRMACYNGTTRWCSGDGEAAFRIKDMASKEYEMVDCPCERAAFDFKGKGKCKTTGKLSVIIEGAQVVGGVWTFRTTSWNSVQSIYSSLVLIKRITGGPLAGIPLNMILSAKTATTPEGATTKVYIVSLEYRGTPQQLRGEGLKMLSEGIEHRTRLELMEHQIEDMIQRDMLMSGSADDDAEFTEEFYPEQAEAQGPPTTPPPANIGSVGSTPRPPFQPVQPVQPARTEPAKVQVIPPNTPPPVNDAEPARRRGRPAKVEPVRQPLPESLPEPEYVPETEYEPEPENQEQEVFEGPETQVAPNEDKPNEDIFNFF